MIDPQSFIGADLFDGDTMIDRIAILLSKEEQLRRWYITRDKGFFRYFWTHAFAIIPAGAVVFLVLVYLVWKNRLPVIEEYLIAYCSALCFSIPWVFSTWHNSEKMLRNRR